MRSGQTERLYTFTGESRFLQIADLYIQFKHGQRLRLADGDAFQMRVQIGLSWGGTTRSVASAQASIAVYQELTNLAATLESRLSQYDIYVTD